MFQKAVKSNLKARIALIGPAKSGKTYTALTFAQSLGESIAVIDTERGSASKYADEFNFDVAELVQFSPQEYMSHINGASGYDVLIIDSLSHAWNGKGGILEIVDNTSGSSFTNGWRKATPLHNDLIDTILSFDGHVIVTMRTKTAYELQDYIDQNGRKKVQPVKLGLAPVQRDGMEYEFDIIGDLDRHNVLTIQETRCSALREQTFKNPDHEVMDIFKAWLQGEPVTPEDLKSLQALGEMCYGDDWSTKSAELVSYISNGKTDNIEDLTKSQVLRLITGVDQKLKEEGKTFQPSGDGVNVPEPTV